MQLLHFPSSLVFITCTDKYLSMNRTAESKAPSAGMPSNTKSYDVNYLRASDGQWSSLFPLENT